MGRERRERRIRAEQQWPLLLNMFGCYFNEDLDHPYGNLAGAFEAASRDGPLEHRRSILKEWRDWNATEGAVNDIRPFLHDGFGVNVRFDQPIDARHFMNRVYDCLIEQVRAETRP
jgi:hypothetical protein